MASLSASKRVGEIEGLRLFFAFSVVCLHTSNLFGEYLVFPNAAFAVEFFFLVSGYLLMVTMAKLVEKPVDNLGRETVGFVWGKIKPIYLDVVIGYVLGFIVQCVSRSLSPIKIWTLFRRSIFEVLLVQRTGVGANSVNSVVWYLQSMLLCFIILYPLIRKFPRMMSQVIMPLVALLLVGWLMQTEGSFRSPTEWLDNTYKGNIRAMAILCAGASCYGLIQWMKNLRLTVFGCLGITIVKWACWIVTFWYMVQESGKYDDAHLLILLIAVVLAFSQQGIDTPLFQNKFFMLMGKISLPLYLNHMYLARYLKYWVPKDMSNPMKFLVYMCCVVVSTALAMLIAAGLRKVWPHMKGGLARLLVKPAVAEEG